MSSPDENNQTTLSSVFRNEREGEEGGREREGRRRERGRGSVYVRRSEGAKGREKERSERGSRWEQWKDRRREGDRSTKASHYKLAILGIG